EFGAADNRLGVFGCLDPREFLFDDVPHQCSRFLGRRRSGRHSQPFLQVSDRMLAAEQEVRVLTADDNANNLRALRANDNANNLLVLRTNDNANNLLVSTSAIM